jgi:hypothetical protein
VLPKPALAVKVRVGRKVYRASLHEDGAVTLEQGRGPRFFFRRLFLAPCYRYEKGPVRLVSESHEPLSGEPYEAVAAAIERALQETPVAWWIDVVSEETGEILALPPGLRCFPLPPDLTGVYTAEVLRHGDEEIARFSGAQGAVLTFPLGARLTVLSEARRGQPHLMEHDAGDFQGSRKEGRWRLYSVYF